jgi:hypothetical protein
MTLADVETFLGARGWRHEPEARSVWFAGSRAYVRGEDVIGLPVHEKYIDTASRLDDAVREALRCDGVNGRELREAYVRVALGATK